MSHCFRCLLVVLVWQSAGGLGGLLVAHANHWTQGKSPWPSSHGAIGDDQLQHLRSPSPTKARGISPNSNKTNTSIRTTGACCCALLMQLLVVFLGDQEDFCLLKLIPWRLRRSHCARHVHAHCHPSPHCNPLKSKLIDFHPRGHLALCGSLK